MILSSSPGLSDGVAKVWGTGYLLMASGPSWGKKNGIFHLPQSKIAMKNPQIFFWIFPGMLEPRVVVFPSLSAVFSSLFPVFMTKIPEDGYLFHFLTVPHTIPVVLQQLWLHLNPKSQCCHRSSSRKGRRPWLGAPYLVEAKKMSQNLGF